MKPGAIQIDPEPMIHMLILGYCKYSRSARLPQNSAATKRSAVMALYQRVKALAALIQARIGQVGDAQQ